MRENDKENKNKRKRNGVRVVNNKHKSKREGVREKRGEKARERERDLHFFYFQLYFGTVFSLFTENYKIQYSSES